MNREKTVKEWLHELPYGYRQRALAQIDSLWANVIVYCMKDAIFWGLTFWDKTTEGDIFWGSVYDHYLTNGSDPLPPLPNN